MIKLEEFESDLPYGPWASRGCDVWDAICAAVNGDAAALRRLLVYDPRLSRYGEPLYFAVREGHLDAVNVLLDAGADGGEELLTLARDRDHEHVAQLLERTRTRRGRIKPAEADHPIHVAAAANDVATLRALLDTEPGLVQLSDRSGGTPLHRAVVASARDSVNLLLDRGADPHALHGAGPRSERGYAAVDFQPIDLALWDGPFWGVRGDIRTARLLLERGAKYDLVVASALGDFERVKALLDEDLKRANEARPCGKKALSSAVQFEHESIVRMLLDRGADPNSPEGSNAPRGAALHAAARTGNRQFVELLLAYGADPNSYIDSSGSATYVAKTRELRALLFAHGGTLDTYDLVWLGEDDEVVQRVSADPSSANSGCGGVFAAACTQGKCDLVVRLLAAGARVPATVNACRSYLWSDPESLRLLLASGMDPDLPNWQHATPLHDLCSRDSRGRPRAHRIGCATLFLDAGASISAKDEDYRSTPLAWAARNNVPDMVEFLLSRGAPTNLLDDEPWATPLAWATKRGHGHIVEILRAAGATA